MKINTTGGQIHGITQDGLDIFLGIPYAEPPVHDNRFKHSTLKTQWSEPIDATEIQPIPPQPDNKLEDFFSSQSTTFTEHEDCLYLCAFMVNEGHISTSLIQRHFQIGYNRAARIIDQLEQLGYVSSANGSKPRDVYVTEADLNKE